MSSIRRFSELYGAFIADHPYILVLLVIVVALVSSFGNSLLKTTAMDQKDMLPKDDQTVKDLNFLEDEFGGSETALLVVEIKAGQSGSNEVVDVRDPRVMEYVDILAQKAEKLEDVTQVTSAADLVRRQGRIPQSKSSIDTLLGDNPQSARYISRDFSMSLVRMNLADKFDETRLYDELTSIVDDTPSPPGISATPSGSVVVSSSIKNQIGPDMAKTGQISLFLVLLLVLITFGSVRYGLTSLLAIFLGTMWSFGLLGFLGMDITSQTSAGLSMIFGIGIDFGIQVVARFRIEARKAGVRKGMIETLDAVILPMSTTTLAALIGFRAMSLGELTVLRDLASMMSIGILCCMMAALTIVPCALVLGGDMSKFALSGLRRIVGEWVFARVPVGAITILFGDEFQQNGGKQ
jgi:predicted RND superfamily exporter protein